VLKLAIITERGIVIGETELSPNPADWICIGGLIHNYEPIAVKVIRAGVPVAMCIYDHAKFSQVMPAQLSSHTCNVGDSIIVYRGAVMIQHHVAERFILRGFY
jgi:hypothetical protein